MIVIDYSSSMSKYLFDWCTSILKNETPAYYGITHFGYTDEYRKRCDIEYRPHDEDCRTLMLETLSEFTMEYGFSLTIIKSSRTTYSYIKSLTFDDEASYADFLLRAT